MGGYNPASGLNGELLQGLGAVAQAAPTASTAQALAGAYQQYLGQGYGYVYYTTATTNQVTYNTPFATPGAFVEAQTVNIGYQQQWVQWNREYTEEQLRHLEELRQEQQREFERQAAEHNTACAVAHELLLSCLSPIQAMEYRTSRQFFVTCPSGNRYVLSYSNAPMHVNEDGHADISYCIHTAGIPREDELLGFKLLLEANEDLFLSTANATRLRPPRARVAA